MSCHNTKIWNFLQDFNGFLAIMIYASWMQKGISKQSVISQFMECNLIFWDCLQVIQGQNCLKKKF